MLKKGQFSHFSILFVLKGFPKAQVLHWAVLSPSGTGEDGKECSCRMYSWDTARLHSKGMIIESCHTNNNASRNDNSNHHMKSPVGEKAVDRLFASPRYHHGTDGPSHTRIPGCAGGSGQLWSTHVPRQKSGQHHQDTSKNHLEFKTQWYSESYLSWSSCNADFTARMFS